MRNVETSPRRLKVTRSPKQAAIGGAMLSGSKANFRQKMTSVHMKDPRIKLDKQAEVIPVDATIMNSMIPDFGFVELWGI